jgi:hypothetical protein
MKINKLILLILILFHQLVSAQQNCNLNYQEENRFKEIYDYLCAHKFSNSNPDEPEITALSYSANNYTYPSNYTEAELQFGNLDNVGPLLESLIRMYEITHDKAYLIKAINQSIQLMSARNGATAPDQYAWASGWNNTGISSNKDTYIPYSPSKILHPMAHLCHLILIDEYSTLCPAALPVSPTNLIPDLPTLPQNTYGQFADWLVHECVKSLDWSISRFWLGDTEGFREEHEGGFGGAINQQADYAAALFYLGHLTDINPCFAYQGYYSGLQSYMDKASNLAYLYNSDIKLYTPYNLFPWQGTPGYQWCYPSENFPCFTKPVFNYVASTDSYWWYVTGWGFPKDHIDNLLSDCDGEYRVDCQYYIDINPDADLGDYRAIEDISHGIVTLSYPRILNKYNATSGGSLMFDNTKMLRFRNVIKNVAWNQDSYAPKFYSTVRGVNYDAYASSSVCNPLPCEFDVLKYDVLQWMSFAEYEYPNSDLYNILTNKFKYLLDSHSIGNFSNGGKMLSMAEFTDQTWKRACYDLTLYNRKLTYNQNFYAKHNLDIFPTADNCYHAANDESFADPIITSNDFVIEQQVHAVFEADNRVTLKGEVHFKAGSEVTVRNTLGSCYTNGRTSNQTASNEGETIEMPPSLQQQTIPLVEPLDDKVINTKNSITLTPNPANKQFTVSSYEPFTQIIIYSLTGQTMAQMQQLNHTKFDFNVNEIPNGVYFLSIETQAGKEIKKVVIAKD